MQKILQESQILGPIRSYARYVNTNTIIIEAFENYQKRSARNRYKILSPNGILNMSIPLKSGKNNRMIITDVEISYDSKWVSNHINTIKTCYGNAAFYEFYSDEIYAIFQKKPRFLFDFNLEFLGLMNQLIGINAIIEKSNKYHQSMRNDYDFCYFEKNTENHSDVSIKYPQVFEEKFDFVDNLSILDLIFCLGNESSLYLKKLLLSQKENKVE